MLFLFINQRGLILLSQIEAVNISFYTEVFHLRDTHKFNTVLKNM